VAVSLAVDECAVDVEDDSFQTAHLFSRYARIRASTASAVKP
jgi:hypothetical protein